MKVLCIIDSLGSGGAQRQLVELAVAFEECGNNVHFLTYHADDYYFDVLNDANINNTCIQEHNYFKRFLKMRRFIRNGDFDLVLSFLESASFIATLSGIPFRKWTLIVGERSSDPRMFKSIRLRFYRWVHLLADHVVANSNENVRMIRKINPFLTARKCVVIYNMVDLEKWSPAKNYVPYNSNKLKILVASNHSPAKNLIGLVEGVNKLSLSEKKKLQIDWYGAGQDQFMCFTQAKRLIQRYQLNNIFNFYPATNSILSIMQQADVVGLFSTHEGLPNAICEGMAVGKPILAPRVSDLPLIINKDNGVLFNPYDIDSIHVALESMINISTAQLQAMGRNSRRLAEQLFSKEKIFQSYKALIN